MADPTVVQAINDLIDLGDGIYGYDERFDEPVKKWVVPIPAGKRFAADQEGEYVVEIDGLPFWGLERIELAPGGQQTALVYYILGLGDGAVSHGTARFRLDDWTPPGGGGGGVTGGGM